MTRLLNSLVCAAAIAACGAAPAAADELGSSVLYGGTTQARIVCYLTNFSGDAVTLRQTRVFSPANPSVALVINQCGTTLSAGATCAIAAAIDNNQVYGCRVRVRDSSALRGSVEIRDSAQAVLNSQAMK